MKKYFSIVTPTWNRAEYLPDMISGILEQDFEDWELIVVDDGSTDTTDDLMAWYVKEYPNIHYYKKEHTGIADTRNFGNSKVQGKWIVVSDSDEIWLPNRLNKTKEYIDTHDVDFISAAMDVSTYKGYFHTETWIPKMPSYERLMNKDQGIMHGACAYKKSLADKIPYRKEQKINDDFWFVVDCWNKKVKFGIIETPLMIYRVLNSGISATHYQEIQEEIAKKLKTEFIRKG